MCKVRAATICHAIFNIYGSTTPASSHNQGYTMRASALTQRLTEAREKIRNSVVDAKAFTALLEHESEVITERKMVGCSEQVCCLVQTKPFLYLTTQSLRREVEVVRSRHAALQLEHKKLLEERDSLKASVAA